MAPKIRLFGPRMEIVLAFSTQEGGSFDMAEPVARKLGGRVVEGAEGGWGIGCSQEVGEGWTELSETDLAKAFDGAYARVAELAAKADGIGNGLVMTGAAAILVAACAQGAWTRPVPRLGGEGGLRTISGAEKETWLSIASAQQGSARGVSGNELRAYPLGCSLYCIGAALPPGKMHEPLRQRNLSVSSFVVDIHAAASEMMAVGPAEPVAGYAPVRDRVSSDVARAAVIAFSLSHLHSTRFSAQKSEVAAINQKVRAMQKEINEVLARLAPGPIDDDLSREEEINKEERFLHEAAIYFSQVAEVEQEIHACAMEAAGLRRAFDGVTGDMGAAAVPSRGDGPGVPDHIEAIRNRADIAVQAFVGLKEDLRTSQGSLRDTVDVLKTFIESQQRSLSDRASRAMDVLAVIFAVFGLTDAVSNIAIYFMEQNQGVANLGLPARTLTLGLFTLSIPATILLVVYFGYLRRKWRSM